MQERATLILSLYCAGTRNINSEPVLCGSVQQDAVLEKHIVQNEYRLVVCFSVKHVG